jgi:hypothetical protein
MGVSLLYNLAREGWTWMMMLPAHNPLTWMSRWVSGWMPGTSDRSTPIYIDLCKVSAGVLWLQSMHRI